MELIIDPIRLTKRRTRCGEFAHVWEHRTLNRHCGVVELQASNRFSSPDGVGQLVRGMVKHEFRPAWFRGFAFGTVIHFTGTASGFRDIDRFHRLIDCRNKSAGVWQWMVICFERDKTAIGIHTWMKHTYLHPIYESVLRQFDAAGYKCDAFYVETPQLFANAEKLRQFSPGRIAFLGIGQLVMSVVNLMRGRGQKNQDHASDLEESP